MNSGRRWQLPLEKGTEEVFKGCVQEDNGGTQHVGRFYGATPGTNACALIDTHEVLDAIKVRREPALYDGFHLYQMHNSSPVARLLCGGDLQRRSGIELEPPKVQLASVS